jgi:Tol biopolymer transport system component
VALTPGGRLGAFEVVSLLGEGGMGQVYRARDTKLNRDVALKILPTAFATDPERLARFKREAQILAALDHPNVGAIYGFEDADGTHALVLQLVEGPTLADRIGQGPLSIDEALPIAKQIAEALETAHEQGIVHRDLKPANIKVTPDGRVKVLDFGLAKLLETDTAGSVRSAMLTNSPTITTPAMTMAGVILGTAAYMSPEQAKGRPADKRSDIWAFGCVLYEMLTGTRAFDGEDISDTLAFVLMKPPAWDTLPKTTPTAVRTLLRRALEKDRKRRLPDIGSARLDIDEAIATSASETHSERSPVAVAASRKGWRVAMPWALAVGFATGFALALANWAPWKQAATPSLFRVSAELGADASLALGGAPGAELALSRDGRLLVFTAQRASGASQLYVRRLDQLTATPLAGTEDARNPFLSPSGEWVGFFAGAKLKKIAVTGGGVVTLCDAMSGRGGTWGENGTIAFTANGSNGVSMSVVSEAGGQPKLLTKLAEGESTHRWPQFLRGGNAILFTSGFTGQYDDAEIVVQQLPDGPRKVVQRGGFYGRYLPSGHLVYVHGGTLFAVPFDLDRLELTGTPAPVAEGVNASTGTGGANFAVSDSGTLVYLQGPSAGLEAPIAWMDRTGKTTPLSATPIAWSNPQFSPDGTRLALDNQIPGGLPAIWVYDWARDTPTRLTFSSRADIRPQWTPDGQRIAFSSTRDGPMNIYWQRADGAGGVQRLSNGARTQIATSWHPSGKFLAFQEQDAQNGLDIMILPVDGDEQSGWKPGKPTAFLNTSFDEQDPQFSPDGKWIAYYSNESGQTEVYVRPFPVTAGSKWQVSNGGGLYPLWSRARPELFYLTIDQHIMVASYTTDSGSFRSNKPQLWSPSRLLNRPRIKSYDVHPDGNRIVVAPIPETSSTKQDKVVFVFNFFDELRRLAPPKR